MASRFKVGDNVIVKRIGGVLDKCELPGVVLELADHFGTLRVRTDPVPGVQHSKDPGWAWYVYARDIERLPYQRVDAGPVTL